MLLFIVIAAIVLLLILITVAKLNPFVSLIITSMLVGFATGMDLQGNHSIHQNGVRQYVIIAGHRSSAWNHAWENDG